MRQAHHRPPNPPANGESHLHPSVLAREAAKVCADLGLHLNGGRIRLLVQDYLRSGYAQHTAFATWLLTYADPTGNEAVARAMRGARRA